MNIRELMIKGKTGDRHVDDFTVQVNLTNDVEPTEETSGLGVVNEYFTQLCISVVTRCNSAEFKRKEPIIERQIMEHLYGHVRDSCFTALNAISSGNKEAALRSINNILKQIEGGD
jgi:hypothetical protein